MKKKTQSPKNHTAEQAADKPFFIEATSDTINDKLIQAGIKGGRLLPPPYVGVSENGIIWEMFMHDAKGKKGWMLHPTGKTIKPECISKYTGQ